MANNINVTLDTSNGANRLSVTDNGGQNQVSQSPNPTTITWHLTGALAQASFVSMSDPSPGFAWVGSTLPGVFGQASIGSGGNSVSITDNHVNSGSNGTWIYMLRVNYNNTVISTEATLPRETVNNPVIINH